MKSPAITSKPTGSIPQQALWLHDTLDDYLGMDDVHFAWSGCLDATHVVPAGSCVPSAWKVGNGLIATTTYQYR